jgi:hypothetical protein
MNKPLSNADIERHLGSDVQILQYYQLGDYSTVERLLGEAGAAVILYPGVDKNPEGHWCGLMYSYNDEGERVIEFFDPYGISVDKELKIVNDKTPRYLSKLLLTSRWPLVFNDNKFQRYAKNIATCGRHVVNRILNKNMSLERYLQCFGGRDADKIVTQLIN